ncbi:MAG: hypothetical protein IT382_01870 [Deltaproteobacteria bacterium]|nr:hypothetical protein [Deltaproteobacteria bacterium]
MTWFPPAKQPEGWCLSVLQKGDTLADLAKAAKLSPVEVAAKNGVPVPPNPAKPGCQWGLDVAAWVLATGGIRLPVVAGQMNKCEPGKGHVAFLPGQKIYLPGGLRPCAAPAPGAPPVATKTPRRAGFLLLLALGAYAAKRAMSKKAKP